MIVLLILVVANQLLECCGIGLEPSSKRQNGAVSDVAALPCNHTL
jgi:hypothetical protein